MKGMTGCVSCGGKLPKQAGSGRPRRYCSEPCRRLAEYEVRRVSRLLGGIEATISAIHIDGQNAGAALMFPEVQAALDAYAREHTRLTERLRMLVSDDLQVENAQGGMA